MKQSNASVYPAPLLEPSFSPGDKWQREYAAFQRLLPQLKQKYLGQYVVIHDGEVVGSGNDDLQLALRFFAKHGNVPVHIGLVTEEPERVLHIPRYRPTSRVGEHE